MNILKIMFQLMVVLATVIAVMFYRAMMIPLFYRWTKNASLAGQDLSSYSSLGVTCSATAINLFCIVVLNKVIRKF